MSALRTRAIGQPLDRIDGPDKVTGAARYAFEHPVEDPVYAYPLESTIPVGRITAITTDVAMAVPGVLAVLTHLNAPRLASVADPELAILQSDLVAFRGQFVGAVIAETSEIARHGAGRVELSYEEQPSTLELSVDQSDLYTPARLNAGFATDTVEGDVEAALTAARFTVVATYATPMEHHNPMEPNSTIAVWNEHGLTLYLATQGVHTFRGMLAPVFGLEQERIRVISPHVGGGFGCRCFPYADVALAVMAAQTIPGRPVKLALTRRHMFTQVGYRAPSSQRIQLGAEADGRLVAIAHDVVQPTARLKEFIEQTGIATRLMYAASNRRTTHRVAALDIPPPNPMRAPGEAIGMFALESAIDELAITAGLDPIELRIRNEPDIDPESDLPYSSRHLVRCLREGADLFGWEARDPTPRAREDHDWLVGTGVAAATYPTYLIPGNTTTIRLGRDGRYKVLIGAADIGTGARTALTQIAADALEVDIDQVELQIGDSSLPAAFIAGGSAGTASWGTTIIQAAQALRARIDAGNTNSPPAEELEVTADLVAHHAGPLAGSPYTERYAMHAFGAQFAEVRVNRTTGEIRVPRLLGMFDVGRVINPKLGHSQLMGGMIGGLSMALHEHSFLDPRFGHVINHDLASYHIAAHADIGTIEVHWLPEVDPHTNPMGSKGIGELGIVGVAAAISNAVYHATGTRVRELPITLDKLLS